MAQSKEYALVIEEEQRPVMPVQRSVNFVDHQQEANQEKTQQLNKQLGELINVLYLDRQDNRKPSGSTAPPPTYRCFNCNQESHFSRGCTQPKAEKTKCKFCKVHRTSSHDDAKCNYQQTLAAGQQPVQPPRAPSPVAHSEEAPQTYGHHGYWGWVEFS
jgi:hypothetical protein